MLLVSVKLLISMPLNTDIYNKICLKLYVFWYIQLLSPLKAQLPPVLKITALYVLEAHQPVCLRSTVLYILRGSSIV